MKLLLKREPAGEIHYSFKPFVLAMRGNKAVVGWLVKIINVRDSHYLRLRKIDFNICNDNPPISIDIIINIKLDKPLINLGLELGKTEKDGYRAVFGSVDKEWQGNSIHMVDITYNETADKPIKLGSNNEIILII